MLSVARLLYDKPSLTQRATEDLEDLITDL